MAAKHFHIVVAKLASYQIIDTMIRRRISSCTTTLDGASKRTAETPVSSAISSHSLPSSRVQTKHDEWLYSLHALVLGVTLLMLLVVLWVLCRGSPSIFSYSYTRSESGENWYQRVDSLVTPQIREILLQESTEDITINDNYVVFVSVSSGDGNETYVQMGRSTESVLEAYREAVSQLWSTQQTMQSQATTREQHNDKPMTWMKVDIVDRLEMVDDYDFSESFEAQVGGPRWFYGIALEDEWEHGWAFVPEEVIANNIMDTKQDRIRWDNMLAYALEKQYTKQKNIMGWRPLLAEHRNVEDISLKRGLHLFQTTSYFIDLVATSTILKPPTLVPVYHGHRIFEKEDITSKLLMEASRAAGDYLIRAIKPSGKFVYVYNPRTDEESESYNLTRHAGTLYAMACLLHKTKDPVLLNRIQLALEWLLKENIERCRLPNTQSIGIDHQSTRRCVVEEAADETRSAKLGLNALTLLAISEFVAASKHFENSHKSQNEHYMNVARDLADYIQAAQNSDGSFVQKIQYYPTFELDSDFYVRYYQGEATFALSRFYGVSGQVGLQQRQEWLDVAEAAARYIVDENWNVADAEFVDDHWLMYGLAELHRCDPRRVSSRFLDFAMRTVNLVATSQYKNDEENADHQNRLDVLDWVGIHHLSSSATSTATKSEGLCAVYDIAVEHHRLEVASRILDTIQDSVRYQLKSQFGPELAMYMRDPKRIVGGLRKGIDSLQMRNDYTQHNLSSFLCLARILQGHADQP